MISIKGRGFFVDEMYVTFIVINRYLQLYTRPMKIHWVVMENA